jgi:hypothetical protein
VNAGQIRVGGRHARRLVASDAGRDMAEHDAWSTFGVDKVVNHIARPNVTARKVELDPAQGRANRGR